MPGSIFTDGIGARLLIKMTDDLKQKLRELERQELELQRIEQELAVRRRAIKEALIAGLPIEPGAYYAELRLLPGRDPDSRDPDDYDLVVSLVS